MSKSAENSIYFVTGGGTGGHIYPALAVAQELVKSENKPKVYYIGNSKNMEYGLVTNKDLPFLDVKISGMPRKFGIDLFRWFFQLLIATVKSIRYIYKYKPDAVFGTGGYVSAPIIIACNILELLKIKHVPYMLHDCDSYPGLVTRKFAKGAKYVNFAFESAKIKVNKKESFVYGNPIRGEFKTLSKEEARNNLGLKDKMTVCITGGSQGSVSINNAAVEILKKLSEKNVQVIFQTGAKNFDSVIEKLQKIYPEYFEDENIIVRPYFNDMVSVMKASDIAVTRSGSLSISELCAAGVVPVFVPYPHAAANHQQINAENIVSLTGALLIQDKDISPQLLLNSVLSLIENPEKFNAVKQKILSLAEYDALSKICECLKSLS